MSDDRRKVNKQSTGTVPKIKGGNNKSYSNERDSPWSWTNNLGTDLQRLNLCYSRNPQRNLSLPANYCNMNTTLDERRLSNPTINGSVTPNTSSSASRRNSGSVLKCDNITKYPDKRQIEDKLTQIREYLQITSNLMMSMKNMDEQIDPVELETMEKMFSDLKDSETKLVDILENLDKNCNTERNQTVTNGLDNYSEAGTSNSHRNELEVKMDLAERGIELLRDQQMSQLSLQQKAENKMKDARQVQDKLLSQCDLNSQSNKNKNLSNIHDIDAAIKELEERSKRLNEPRTSNVNLPDRLLADVDSLHNQIVTLHNLNEDRNQLIEVLDNRDTELRVQHHELQSKLSELQTKKMQVDQLVAQLQNLEEGDDEDVEVPGVQVKRIMTMKDQLSKLKDMLEIVKTTEAVIQNSNATQEEQDLACDICVKAENILQKDGEKRRTPVGQVQESNVRYDNMAGSNENRHKQVNKNSVPSDRQGFGGARPKVTANANKVALQVELEAKKRELEEIMGKHKAGTSNLNHDVGNDNKSEFSCASNAFYEPNPGWLPMMPDHNRFDSSDRYSSDECPEDVNQYSELNCNHNQNYSLPVVNHPRSKSDLREHGSGRLSSVPRTPVRSSSVAASNRGRARSNNEQNTKNQVKKQLELIRSVCDSMLEQQGPNIQLRNNLTPSPLYSEPQRFASPYPHVMNTVATPITEPFWGMPNQNEGWLATNTLQTQAFMLNTLNQCCQMLWLQQRELLTLRQTVGQLQDRVENPQFDSHLTSPMQNPNARSNQKINHVSAACSMPNLNHYNVPQSINVDPSYHNNNARLLDPGLNNANVNTCEHINNSVLHGVNANINSMPSQMWNGQALNNQVAPGNRANNYWDNFRSYSRQNLLSTKSNEGFQNPSLERSNNPYILMTVPKSNSGYSSTSTSQENTPLRRSFVLRNSENRSNSVVPPDVLNVNHNIKDTHETVRNPNLNETNLCFHFPNNETTATSANVAENQMFKECMSETARRRNEWHEEQSEDQYPKSKLFEELREDVYKEVVTLIAANEARPHFLIQLFRDLQMISSDPLRLKILQSIQTIITHSLISSNHIGRQVSETQQNEQIPDCFSLQSTVWSKIPATMTSTNGTHAVTVNEGPEIQNAVKEIIPFLNDHEDDVIGQQFLATLKQVLMESESFQETVGDSVFKKHFSNVLDEVLAQYLGKKLKDVKMHIIQTINELLRGELSFIQLIQETCPENCDSDEIPAGIFENVNPVGQVQNGDLAEADQGRVDDEDVEEEGAVGGFWDLQIEPIGNSDEVELPTIEFTSTDELTQSTQFMKQGLDQVPTRLPTRSRSNTPSKDRSTSSRADQADQF